MSVRCDLHAVDHDLSIEVRTHPATTRNGLDRSFAVAELRVGDGWVTLFLSRDQAVRLARELGGRASLLPGDRDLPAVPALEEEAS